MPLTIQRVRSILRGAPTVTKRYQNVIRFSRSKSRAVEAEFTGVEVTSNGGAMLLAEADRRMGLTQAAASVSWPCGAARKAPGCCGTGSGPAAHQWTTGSP